MRGNDHSTDADAGPHVLLAVAMRGNFHHLSTRSVQPSPRGEGGLAQSRISSSAAPSMRKAVGLNNRKAVR
jgi:hypothetical protein